VLDAKYESVKFWGLLRNMRRKLKSHNEISSDQWLEYFQELLSNPVNINTISTTVTIDNLDLHDIHCDLCVNNEPKSINDDISSHEIEKAITCMPNNKSPGQDGLVIELFKNSWNKTSPLLKLLFNKIFANSNFPVAWCQAIIMPLHKKGSLTDVNNYQSFKFSFRKLV